MNVWGTRVRGAARNGVCGRGTRALAAVLTLALAALLGPGAGAAAAGARRAPGAAGGVGRPGGRVGVASRRPAFIGRHGHSFVPALGDWEGEVEGAPASFELVYEPRFTAEARPPYGYRNLTLVLPDRNNEAPGCPVNPQGSTASIYAEGIAAPLQWGGAFGLSAQDIGGGVGGARSTVLTLRQPAFTPQESACARTLRWNMHPAHRRPVTDGSWRLRFGAGESESLRVTAGGRVVEGIAFPPALAACGGPVGGVMLFVGADGAARYSDPEEGLTVTLDFSSRERASGQMTLPHCTVAMTASLVKPAR